MRPCARTVKHFRTIGERFSPFGDRAPKLITNKNLTNNTINYYHGKKQGRGDEAAGSGKEEAVKMKKPLRPAVMTKPRPHVQNRINDYTFFLGGAGRTMN